MRRGIAINLTSIAANSHHLTVGRDDYGTNRYVPISKCQPRLI
jgi:hypothetical protein